MLFFSLWGDPESQVCLSHGVRSSAWQDGSVSCTAQSFPGYRLMWYLRAWWRRLGPHPTAQQSRVAWYLPLGRSTVGSDGEVGTKASPATKTSQELQHPTAPSQSGFLPPDSCPCTNAAGAWLRREGRHVSPLRESLIHAKRCTSLDLRRGICLFSLTPRLFSSLPAPNPIASAAWAHHAWAAVVLRGAEGFRGRVMYLRCSKSPDPI